MASMCFATSGRSTPLAILLFLFATSQDVLGDQPSTHYTPSTGDIISFTYAACVVVIVTLVFCVFCPICGIYKWRMRRSIDGQISSTSKSVPGYGTSNPSMCLEENVESQTEGYQQNYSTSL